MFLSHGALCRLQLIVTPIRYLKTLDLVFLTSRKKKVLTFMENLKNSLNRYPVLTHAACLILLQNAI